MKTFSDNLEPIKLELIDKEGNKSIKTGRFLSINDLKDFDAILINGRKNKKPFFDIVCEQMAFVFGGNEKEYRKYSNALLNGAMNEVKEVYLLNPMKPVQKK